MSGIYGKMNNNNYHYNPNKYSSYKMIGTTFDPYNTNMIRFSFIIIADFLSSVGYLIYFEFIELRFCKLNEQLRKKIIERAHDDSRLYNSELDSLPDEDIFEIK